MIDNNTITAVMFVFNEEKFIADSITSILNLDHEVDVILVVDDQSRDNTVRIVQSYQKENSHIKYLYNAKKGKTYAYEKGLMNVQTDLFFIMAGDDVLLPNFVSELYFGMLRKYNIKFTYGRYFECDVKLAKKKPIKRNLKYSINEMINYNRTSGYLFGFTDIIKEILPFPHEVGFEDWYTGIRLAKKYNYCYISKNEVFLYRRHTGGDSFRGKSYERHKKMYLRDLKLLEYILTDEALIDHKDHINARIDFLNCKLKSSYLCAWKLLFSKYLTGIEKIKLFIYPVSIRLKYFRA